RKLGEYLQKELRTKPSKTKDEFFNTFTAGPYRVSYTAPNPSSRPLHLFWGHAAGLGIADPVALGRFVQSLRTFDMRTKRQFKRAFVQASVNHRYTHAPFAVWCAANAPVLRRLNGKWKDVERALERLRPDIKWRLDGLKKLCHKHGVKLDFSSGEPARV